ncbi:MAG: type II secretion system protein [Candidatus Paceibacterota bacterium]|jgi:Tfp pilus assembly protein FimT
MIKEQLTTDTPLELTAKKSLLPTGQAAMRTYYKQIFATRKSAVSCQLSNVSCVRNRAFTLVEILIVIGVFMLLTGVVLSNYRNYDSNALFANASENIVLALRQAQVYGAGAKGSGTVCAGGVTTFDCSYGVHFSQGANGVVVFADLNSNRVYDNGIDANLQNVSVNWTNNIAITELSCGGTPCSYNIANVTFRRPNPDAFIAESVENPIISFSFVSITISDSISGRTAVVKITKAGQISIQ